MFFKTIYKHKQLNRFFFSSSNFNYYDILELKPNCSQREIRTNYIRLAKIYHPDIYKGSDNDRFKKIKEAYEILKFPEKREDYDIKINVKTKDQAASETPDYSDTSDSPGSQKAGPSMYKDWDVESKRNINEQYEKFMKKPRITEPEGVIVSDDPFLSQLNFNERMRFEYTFIKNNMEVHFLKYAHQQGYDKSVEDSIELLNYKKMKELDSEKFRREEEQKREEVAKNAKIVSDISFVFIIIPLITLAAFLNGLRKKISREWEKENKKREDVVEMEKLQERIVFR